MVGIEYTLSAKLSKRLVLVIRYIYIYTETQRTLLACVQRIKQSEFKTCRTSLCQVLYANTIRFALSCVIRQH